MVLLAVFLLGLLILQDLHWSGLGDVLTFVSCMHRSISLAVLLVVWSLLVTILLLNNINSYLLDWLFLSFTLLHAITFIVYNSSFYQWENWDLDE